MGIRLDANFEHEITDSDSIAGDTPMRSRAYCSAGIVGFGAAAAVALFLIAGIAPPVTAQQVDLDQNQQGTTATTTRTTVSPTTSLTNRASTAGQASATTAQSASQTSIQTSAASPRANRATTGPVLGAQNHTTNVIFGFPASQYPWPWNNAYGIAAMPNPYAGPYPYLPPVINYPGVSYPYVNPVPPPPAPASTGLIIYVAPYSYGGPNVFIAPYILYGGSQDYFDGSQIVWTSSPDTIDAGTVYNYSYDPYDTGTTTVYQYGYDAHAASVSNAALPSGLDQSLRDVAQSWQTGRIAGLQNHLSPGGSVQVGFDGQYAYSIRSNGYAQMTRDAMARVTTTDFRYTHVGLDSKGNAVCHAVQKYRAANGSVSTIYLTYNLRRDPSLAGGYAIVGFYSSTTAG
jgi:hypothetical protein